MNRDSAVFFEPDNYLSICSKCKHEEVHLATVPLSKEAWLKRVFFLFFKKSHLAWKFEGSILFVLTS